MSDNNESIGIKLVTVALAVIIAIIVGLGTLYIINGIRSQGKDANTEAAMAKLTPAALTQKEYARPYMEWMMKYCLESQEKRKFSEQQQIDYCACFQSEKVLRINMAEQSAAVSAHWDAAKIPETQKKLDEIDAQCLQQILK